jgi:hypothetical protein
MGSAIWVSIWTVVARKRAFERRFGEVIRSKRNGHGLWRRSLSRVGVVMEEDNFGDRLDRVQKPDEPEHRHDFESRHSGPRDPTSRLGEDGAVEGKASGREDDGVVRGRVGHDQDQITLSSPGNHHRHLSFASPHSPRLIHRHHQFSSATTQEAAFDEKDNQESLDQTTYPTYLTRHTTGRNAQFYGLSRAEREHLGGVEYRAITLLSYVVPIYFVAFNLLGGLGLGAYFHHNKKGVIRENGINAW